MVDDSIAGPPAKKRGATRQISKDDGSDSESESFLPRESGSFQKASEEVIASRRIVKVRRPAVAVAQGPPAPNPFASIRLVAPTASSVVPAVTLPSVSPLAPLVEPLQEAAGINDRGTALGSKDAGQADEAQDGTGEAEVTGESVEVSVANADGSTVAGKEQRSENGDGKSEIPESLTVKDDAKAEVDFDVDSKVDVGSDASAPATAPSLDKVLEAGNGGGGGLDDKNKENLKTQSDTGGKQDAEEKELGVLEQGDKAKAALGISGDQGVGKDSLLPLGAATSGSFSFGTAPSSFETPTAFASFSSTWAAFGSGTASGTSLGSGFGFSKAASEGAFVTASTAFGNSNGSSFQLFNNQSSNTPLNSGPPPQPPPSAVQFQGGNTPTGEEQEKMVFGADATLFEFVDNAWKERGKGELRVNAPLDTMGKARLLMRSKGNFRLILNASLFPDMKMASMDSRGVTFACANSAVEEKSGLATYALKFKDSVAAGSFRDVVDAHKSAPLESLKTPENSPSSLHGS